MLMGWLYMWYMRDQILQAASDTAGLGMLTISLEHARLKDHVASMNGGLEAKIHEGFVLPTFFF